MATVKLAYESNLNISFRGVVDTGIERTDWDAMSHGERTDFMTDRVWELVDMYETDDDAEEE